MGILITHMTASAAVGSMLAVFGSTACDSPEMRLAAAQEVPPPVHAGPTPNIVPEALRPIVGPLILRTPAPAVPAVAVYDQRFIETETGRYADFMKQVARGTGWTDPNHYGGLRSRLMWAIRTGEPIGPAATAETFAYGRGRQIVLRYLENSKRNGFARQAHHNTAIPDIEALYVLEKNEDALAHIHVTAMDATRDQYNYLKMRNPNSDARQVTVALQAVMAAHRLGIPFERSPANRTRGFDGSLGSWKAVGEQLISWMRDYAIKEDGSIPSPAHKGNEAYLFNAWLATELLNWCAHIEWDPQVIDLSRRIMDHLIASQRSGWPTLGYLTNSRDPAPDLAAFYVWPALVLWQETGDEKYREFAISNLTATRRAHVAGIKQWNQTYSTLAQGAEALLSGASWR